VLIQCVGRQEFVDLDEVRARLPEGLQYSRLRFLGRRAGGAPLGRHRPRLPLLAHGALGSHDVIATRCAAFIACAAEHCVSLENCISVSMTSSNQRAARPPGATFPLRARVSGHACSAVDFTRIVAAAQQASLRLL